MKRPDSTNKKMNRDTRTPPAPAAGMHRHPKAEAFSMLRASSGCFKQDF